MMPSSDTPNGAEGPRTNNLRRYGPLAVIVVALIVVGILVFASRDDNKKPSVTASGSASTSSETPSATGAISFSQAKRSGRTDLTFPTTCDTTEGRVAMPTSYPVECYANQPAVTDANTRGVTNDTITVVVYIQPESDPIYDFITAAIHNEDTRAQVEETYSKFNELYGAYFQTYGRKVQLKFLHGSGLSNDAVAARADAVKAADEMGAFAVWGGPVLTNAWTNELNARGVVCLACFQVDKPEPNVFTIAEGTDQSRALFTEYVSKRLANKPAQFAGDKAFTTQNRVFGDLYIDTGGTEKQDAADLKSKFAAEGMKLDTQIGYALDPGRLQEQAVTAITQLKQAGVTSVIFRGDPVAPATFTKVATEQNYFPEWVIGPSALVDTTAFGRTYDQQQWAHAFGWSDLVARVAPEQADYYSLYKWYTGSAPPAKDTSGVLWPQVAQFYGALQAAGPKLNTDTFREGLFSLAPVTGHVTTVTISYGQHGYWTGDDYYGIDDFTEIWWDPNATGPDEIRKVGKGMYQYSEGGKRFLPGKVTSDTHAFDPKGAVALYTTRPPGEELKDYPSPAH